MAFQETFYAVQEAVRGRLRDNFDTAGAIKHLLDLVRHTNIYMQVPSASHPENMPLASLPSQVLSYITEMFDIFGAPFLGKDNKVGYEVQNTNGKRQLQQLKELTMRLC